jgi:hypothetical protein
MTLGFIYWLILLLWLIFGAWRGFAPNGDRFFFGGSLIVFILFALIGWQVWGSPLQRTESAPPNSSETSGRYSNSRN